MRIVDDLLRGDPRALARAISHVEENAGSAAGIVRAIYGRTGRATVLGVTGSPGAGKSSLVDGLVREYRRAGRRVGVVAVDPSSAFSGGAILGDRIRMLDHATDPGVFIRSMATRGHLGGLARATNDAIDLLDAAGYDPVLVETVGVGQDEVDIVKTADVVCVVLVPGMGDDVQAIKAGILEIADLFVVNKADRDGVERLVADLEYVLSLAPDSGRPRPSIVRTVAVRNEGVSALGEAIGAYLESTGERKRKLRRRERAEARLLAALEERLVARMRTEMFPGESFARLVERIAGREEDPYSAVDGIMKRLEVR
jgi:LAO/AO transport system kinase